MSAAPWGWMWSQAFNDIVTGFGRMSPMILDNLGITVDMEGATAKYAQTLGTTSAKLTDAQRKQALLNEVIESSKDLLASKSSEGDAMAASFERRGIDCQYEIITRRIVLAGGGGGGAVDCECG